MPELPEVETVRRSLAPLIVGAWIAEVWTSGKPLRLNRPVEVRKLRAIAAGRRIIAAHRRAKYLLVELDQGGVIVVHLGMTGQLLVTDAAAPRPRHTHVVFALGDGRELRFVDPRRFGVVKPFRSAADCDAWPELGKLGIDPLGPELTSERVHALGRATTRGLKLLLLDQAKIAGLGNIYVSEALWEAGLHPHKAGTSLTRAQAARLRDSIVLVLERGLQNRGTSLSDYVDGTGTPGDNQKALRVYGREGEACFRCATGRISAVVTQGRATFYCPKCQTR
jgi:formamidopyrimidine-DNA glycosylase